jgi:hypothetical protein
MADRGMSQQDAGIARAVLDPGIAQKWHRTAQRVLGFHASISASRSAWSCETSASMISVRSPPMICGRA